MEEGGGESITVHVKFGGRSIPVALPEESKARDLKSLLQPLTNVLPRGQKLIFRGKVLTDLASLKSSQVTNGSKLMMIASQGLHQGDGPITKDTTSTSSNFRRTVDAGQSQLSKTYTTNEKSRIECWRITGVVALSECKLKDAHELNSILIYRCVWSIAVVPEEVWTCGASARVLDISNNLIQEIPATIGSLRSLNVFTHDGISWEGLSLLKSLKVLSLSYNHLTTLPSALGILTSLSELHVANNKLTSLPDELGFLTNLQILKAGNNRISSVSSSLANCCSLTEIDLSSNLLAELPETVGNLKSLKALYLSNNGLKSLPSTLFKMCSQLSTLDLHGTELTNDVLRQIEGWENFDERRRSKHQKQLDFRVGSSGAFDEGADDDRRRT